MNFRADDNFDPYRELQLSERAEPELIKAAFKALAKKYHPDQFQDPTEKARAEARMARINEAQRILLSGEYRPPVSEPRPTEESPRPTETVSPPPRKAPPPRHTREKVDRRASARLSGQAFLIFSIALLVALVLPNFLSENHLENALSLEKEGSFQKALTEINSAIERSPHDRTLYAHRARLWEQLGHPDRAEVDRANAEPQQLQSFSPTQTPTISPSP